MLAFGQIAPRESAVAWELRGAWFSQKEVVIRLDPEMTALPRVQGYIEHVASTGAFAVVRDLAGSCHVPLSAVLSVRAPHFDEPLDLPPGKIPRPPAWPSVPAGQLELDLTGQPQLASW